MGFFNNLIRNAVDESIGKGIRDAVEKAVEGVVAPQPESAEKMTPASVPAVQTTGIALSKDLLKEWQEKIPDFPVWCFGGTEFWFGDCGTTADGNLYHVFYAENADYEDLDRYIALLKSKGFVRKYPTADEVLYKDLGGEYLVFGCTEAFGSAPTMSVTMYRTGDRSEIQI